MIDENDFKYNKSGNKIYKCYCEECKGDRGYQDKCEGPKLCKSCTSSNRWKDKNLTELHTWKKKISCTNRGIKLEEFDDFTISENIHERKRFRDSGIYKQCFELANYICDISKERGCKLNAHHLESWHSNKELRCDINNLVCLSEGIHKEFHSKYGSKNNTKEQYEEFKKAKLLELGPIKF